MYNTLNTLSKKAYLEGSEEISDLLVSVADLLRYNLKQIERAVTIRDELMIVKKYMEIQKARFTDRLQLHLHIDESCIDILHKLSNSSCICFYGLLASVQIFYKAIKIYVFYGFYLFCVRWETLVKPGKKLRPGTIVSFGDGLLKAEILSTLDDRGRIVKCL